MLRKLLLGKIHHAVITQCDPDYVGSITIDATLLEASGIRPNESVMVFDIENAARFETYVVKGERGSGIIGVNGAAAKLVNTGDRVIIVAFGYLPPEKLDDHGATVVLVGEGNKVKKQFRVGSTLP